MWWGILWQIERSVTHRIKKGHNKTNIWLECRRTKETGIVGRWRNEIQPARIMELVVNHWSQICGLYFKKCKREGTSSTDLPFSYKRTWDFFYRRRDNIHCKNWSGKEQFQNFKEKKGYKQFSESIVMIAKEKKGEPWSLGKMFDD